MYYDDWGFDGYDGWGYGGYGGYGFNPAWWIFPFLFLPFFFPFF